MNHGKWVSVLIAVLLVYVSCEKLNGAIEIRIENVSSFEYEEIKVIPFDEELELFFLFPDQVSDCNVFKRLYSYSYVKLLIDRVQYIIQPTGFVGEKELYNGKYTYQIDVNNFIGIYGKLSLTLRVDREKRHQTNHDLW
ncbi:MAG: hypothetical protein AAGG68_20310 [Bacteroidota bacterium]